jgi:hypothetical protein
LIGRIKTDVEIGKGSPKICYGFADRFCALAREIGDRPPVALLITTNLVAHLYQFVGEPTQKMGVAVVPV